MKSNNPNSQPELREVRCTFFFDGTWDQTRVSEAFRELTQREPDNVTIQGPMIVVHSQLSERAMFILQATPGRLDIIWSGTYGNPPPCLGTYSKESLLALISSLHNREGAITQLENINRIALSGSIISRVKTQEEACSLILHNVSNIKNLTPDIVNDFLYRINMRKTDRISERDIAINRICSWMLVEGIILSPIAPNPLTMKNMFVGFDFDINSQPSIDLRFNVETAVETVRLFGKHAIELIERGDE